MSKDRFAGTALIVGAGFSRPAGLPLTSELSSQFVRFRETRPTPMPVQKAISRQLSRFWETVFGYTQESTIYPSFEDHFTALDLAANAGHNLGHYTPAQLRALRRLSIHRVFDILDASYAPSPLLRAFLGEFARSRRTCIISTNWDVVAENHLGEADVTYTYGIPGNWSTREDPPDDALPLIKLHGSANWHYCDVCRTVDFGIPGKRILLFRTFLESRDFAALGEEEVAPDVERLGLGGQPCHLCQNRRMSARVATFSYSKAFDFFPFHASWDAALTFLGDAPFWTFIGYSLPESDFAFKHMLKTAQKASADHKQVRVVTKDASGIVENRFRRLFGQRLVEFHNHGVEAWIKAFDL